MHVAAQHDALDAWPQRQYALSHYELLVHAHVCMLSGVVVPGTSWCRDY